MRCSTRRERASVCVQRWLHTYRRLRLHMLLFTLVESRHLSLQLFDQAFGFRRGRGVAIRVTIRRFSVLCHPSRRRAARALPGMYAEMYTSAKDNQKGGVAAFLVLCPGDSSVHEHRGAGTAPNFGQTDDAWQ